MHLRALYTVHARGPCCLLASPDPVCAPSFAQADLEEGQHSAWIKDYHRIADMPDRRGLRRDVEAAQLLRLAHLHSVVEDTYDKHAGITSSETFGEARRAHPGSVDAEPMSLPVDHFECVALPRNEQAALEDRFQICDFGAVECRAQENTGSICISPGLEERGLDR